MNQFRFANLEWLHAMWIIVGLAGLLIMLELRGGRIMERLLSPLMQSRLVRRPSMTRRVWGVLLLCAALSALVLALMRPQWGSSVQLQTRVDSQIMICLDVSRSMLAEDVVPNRLERAQAEIDSLLSLMRDGQQVGLLAFAGKSTVLCPLTTDFGFLRMILTEANPATVGLGGTRIGDAIRKAVDGFRDVGDVNRLILLITDGEDHDSFPLDAAQAAKEKGVRIVSIGFGDELGSKIEVTDPRTGARSFIQDRDGAAVISRLDGETLREIALETQGAYIPAGTGALDWQSLYSAHIAGYLKGSTAEAETVVRNEAYQWCVLVALILLLASLASPTLFAQNPSLVGSPQSVRSSSPRAVGALLAGLLGVGGVAAGRPAFGQLADRDVPTSATTEADPAGSEPLDRSDSPNDAVDSSSPDEDLSDDPRELYNRAVAYVTTDPQRAERLLNASRRVAGVDGEVRYRALFNLGWVEIQRADQLLKGEPAQALKHLELAAGRFREAIRVRPESDEARHNLEIISRRILELSDSLADHAVGKIAERLDELIVRMREHLSELQKLCNAVAAAGTNVESLRLEFRQLGVVERQLISDFEKLSADARRQSTAAQSTAAQSTSTPQSNATAEQAVETAQLTAMLVYADNAVQRMHKARSFVRRLQAERAFVRWAASLTDAKRARDQLREPLEVLGVLIADATEQLQLIQLMQWSSGQAANLPTAIDKPSWLSDEVLSDGQLATTERTDELFRLLSSGLEQAQSRTAANPQTGSATQQPEQELVLQLESALPAIERAKQHFARAAETIADQNWNSMAQEHTAGISALMEAAECFYDLRRLIDATLADQRGISTGLNAPDAAAEMALEPLITAQEKNLQRVERLADMLNEELKNIETAVASGPDGSEIGRGPTIPDTDATAGAEAVGKAMEEAAVEKERLELAEQMRKSAEQSMQRLLGKLRNPDLSESESGSTTSTQEERPPAPRIGKAPNSSAPVVAASRAHPSAVLSDEAVQPLEELQRLFFSVIEHLKQTAERQNELNDTTTELLAQPEQQTAARLGSLQMRQQALERTAQGIAEALSAQATQLESTASPDAEPAPSPNGEASTAEPSSPSQSEKFTQAAQLVRDGAQGMASAQVALAAAAPHDATETKVDNPAQTQTKTQPLMQVSDDQQVALQKLLEALELLEPPSEKQPQQQPQQQPQDRAEEKTESNPQNMDAEQMLQAIREREANRRRERQPQTSAAAGVEKDW